VDVDDESILFAQVHEHPVAQDAGVIHQNVQDAVGLEGALDETLSALPLRDVVVMATASPPWP